jgi:DNA-directed RNA polymerase subunit RPC12/RpoP
MHEDIFNTEREFNNKFPNKLYICSNCGQLTDNRYTCSRCGWRADGLFKTMGNGYKYTIAETGITEEIFLPIELYKQERNEQWQKLD